MSRIRTGVFWKMVNYNLLYSDLKDVKIQGLGKVQLGKFNKLGVHTLYDLLYFFPRAYENRGNSKKIDKILADEFVILTGTIVNISSQFAARRPMFKAILADETGMIELVWFNNKFVKNYVHVGDEVSVYGKVRKTMKFQMINPEFKRDEQIAEAMLPIYPSTASLKQPTIRKIVEKALFEYAYLLEENIPKELMEQEKGLVREFIDSLNYELTRAQKRVITEIYKELKNGKIVNRLIQGDVGSGKTIVSFIILLYIVENGYQGVIMAPTEILATQHYLGIVDQFNNLDVRVELLTGSLKGKKKEKLLLEIENGVVDIVIGTHSLIEDNVIFKNLGLIVIDEQHRFGVTQRKLLREKGNLENLIVMSATPIPRSLALTIYGDLDVSIIDELPKGRSPIVTKWIKSEEEKRKMYEFIEKKLRKGRQAYVVSPLIEESETLGNIKSAQETFEEYSAIFSNWKIGLIHGRQKYQEKEEVMRLFKKGEIDILVSTTVIEVGVNVPNASIMVIRDAQRFGLSSLHQLRGRVGRGIHQSYCFLESETTNKISIKRLEAMESTTDGFKIAEEDLKLRNSGEILGTRQSGISDMLFTDIVKNVREIKIVRDFVIEYLKNNNGDIGNEFLKLDIYHKFFN